MSDNRNNRGEPDPSLLNKNQRWEWEHELTKLMKEFPLCSEQEIKFALTTAIKLIQVTEQSESREKIEEATRNSLERISRNRG